MPTTTPARAARRPKATHKDIVAAVKTLALSVGGRPRLTHQSGPKRGDKGMPDIYVQMPRTARVRPGMAFWFEAKTEDDDETPEQREFRRIEEEADRIVLVGDVDALTEFYGLTSG